MTSQNHKTTKPKLAPASKPNPYSFPMSSPEHLLNTETGADTSHLSYQVSNSDSITTDGIQPELAKKKPYGRYVFICFILIMLILGIIFRADVDKALISLESFVLKIGWLGPFVIAIVYIISTILMVPGSILTVLSGFIFVRAYGFSLGIFIAYLAVGTGSVLGATCAFLIGRYFLTSWVEEKMTQNPKFSALNKSMESEGWKLVMLMRLSPILPFNFLNYALSISKVPTIKYILSSLFGMMPGTFLYIIIGGSAANISDVSNSNKSTTAQIFLWIGIAITVILFGVIIWYAKKVVNRKMAQINLETESEADYSDSPKKQTEFDPLLHTA